jgi:hypothetical protein
VIPPDDPRHGTTRGHAAGCRELCCRRARNADAKRSKIERAQGRHRTVDAAGTQRRIRALYRLGWTSTHIATAAGWGTAEAVSETLKRSRVMLATAARVTSAYAALGSTPGPSARTRIRAERAGWPPPIHWDDDTIDDSAATPYEPVKIDRRAALIENVEDLLAAGETLIDVIAARCDTSPRALDRQLQRLGRSDLLRRMTGRPNSRDYTRAA